MLNENELRQRVLTTANRGMQSLLEGTFDLVPEDPFHEWDPTLRRYVFAQALVVWRPFDEIRMTVSSDGQIRSFHDRNRFDRAVYERLPDPDILSICRTTGVIGPAAAVAGIQRSGEMLVADIVEPFPDRPRRVSFTINPSTRQVAAFETLGQDLP